jgi:hypothetical protein
MEVPIIIVTTQVEGLEKLVIPKPISLVIPKIGVGVEVTLIDFVIHAFEVFKTLDIILKDTLVARRLGSQPITLVKPINTTSEQLVDDLILGVKEVVLGD